MIDHIGVGGIADRTGLSTRVDDFLRHLHQLAHTAIERTTKLTFGLQVAGFHPAVLVAHLTVLEVHRMYHAIAIQRVDIVVGLKCHIRAIAHKGAQQSGRHLPFDAQLILIKVPLFIDGRIIILQVGKGTQIHGKTSGRLNIT